MKDKRETPVPASASAHDEAADRHMNAAVLWRDLGQVQRAVLEVRYAMVARQLAQLERDRATIEQAHDEASAASATVALAPLFRQRAMTMKGAVEVVYADDAWRVMWDGEPETDSAHQFRIPAVVVAHERARRARCDFIVRGRDGVTRSRGDDELATLEERNAEIERKGADLERDRADLVAQRDDVG